MGPKFSGITSARVSKTWVEQGVRCTVERSLANAQDAREIHELESIITKVRPLNTYYPVDPSQPAFDLTVCDEGGCRSVAVAGPLIVDPDAEFLVDRAGRLGDFLDRMVAGGQVKRQRLRDFLQTTSA